MNREVRNAQILEAWQRGRLIVEIAREFGLSPTWVGGLLRQLGADVPTTGRGIKCMLDIRKLVEQYESGMSIREIAARHKVSYGKVYRDLMGAGVKLRRRGAAAR